MPEANAEKPAIHDINATTLLILPVICAFFASWVGLSLYQIATKWRPLGFSILAFSTLIAAACWVARIFFLAGFDVWHAFGSRLVVTLTFAFPTSVIVPPMLYAYIRMMLGGEVRLKPTVVIGTSIGSLSLNGLFLWVLLSGTSS